MKDSVIPSVVTMELAQVLLQERNLAARLQLSVKCIQMWRLSGKGPPYLKLGKGGAVRYRLMDVMAWEQACLLTSTSSDQAQ